MTSRKFWGAAAYLLISMCGASMTAVFTILRTNRSLYAVLGMAASFAIFAVLCFKYDMPKRLLSSAKLSRALMAAILSGTAVYRYYVHICRLAAEGSPITRILERLSLSFVSSGFLTVVIALSMFAAGFFILLWFIQWFFDLMGDFIRSLDKAERVFLICSIGILAVVALILYSRTNAFYFPISKDGEPIFYDVLFSSDSGILTFYDDFVIFNGSQNDIRNPMFGVFAMPFALLATLLGRLFFFMPFAYPYFLILIEGVLLLLGIVMLERMMELSPYGRLPFLLLMTFSFPVLFNLLNIEQYSLSVFWIIILVYSYVFDKDRRVLCYMGATGSMITTGALFPLLLDRGSFSWRTFWKKLARAVIITLCTLMVFGFIYYLCECLLSDLDKWLSESQGAPLESKIMQFFTLLCSLFVMPRSGLVSNEFTEFAYDALPVTSLNPVGCLLFVLAIVGFAANRKSPFARICLGWIGLSIFILVIVGWGAVWNCMTLYSLYFVWAYVPLVYMAVDKLLSRIPRVRPVALYALAAGVGIYNFVKFADVIKFCVTYYPC